METLSTKNPTEEHRALHIDIAPIKRATFILKAVNHELRQQILHLIHEHGRLSVGQIYKQLQLEQSIASQHLSYLRKAGIVETAREGNFIYYSINHDRLDEIHRVANSL